MRRSESNAASRISLSAFPGFLFRRHWIKPASLGACGLSLPAWIRYPVPKTVIIAPPRDSVEEVAWLLGHQ